MNTTYCIHNVKKVVINKQRTIGSASKQEYDVLDIRVFIEEDNGEFSSHEITLFSGDEKKIVVEQK